MLLVGCRRAPSPGADSGPKDAETDAAPVASAALDARAPRRDPPPVSLGAEAARRRRVARLEEEPSLAANAEVLRRHFGAPFPRPLVVEIASLGARGRRVLLVGDDAKARARGLGQADPIVLVVDARDTLLWSKETPAAGIMAPVGDLTIAAGPRGRVAMAACDPPTSTVALRLWDDDGSPFADFVALSVERCVAVSLLHFPPHGWVLAASREGGAAAQRVTESGGLAWGSGVSITSPSGAPIALAADTSRTFIAAQVARVSAVREAKEHVLAFRYDIDGAPLWPAAVSLGEAPGGRGEDRVALERARPGIVRATMGAPRGRVVEVASSGEIVAADGGAR